MAKDQSFAAKVARGAHMSGGDHCPVCDEKYNWIKRISPIKSSERDSFKFNQGMLAVCNCNKKEILG